MKKILALVFICLLFVESVCLGLFFLLFYPLELGIPLFIVLTIFAFGAIYIFIFILKMNIDNTSDKLKKEKKRQLKLEKLQNKINEIKER